MQWMWIEGRARGIAKSVITAESLGTLSNTAEIKKK